MYGFIYITTNHINNKKYIGQRKYDKNDKWKDYLGSGIHIKRAIQKYGKENFSKEILEECESKEILDQKEKYWISYYNAVESMDFYNIANGGQGGDIYLYLNDEQTNVVKDKLSKSHKGLNSGEKCSKAILTECQVKEIIDMLLKSYTSIEIAEKFGVRKNIIHNIKNHKTWKHLTENLNFPNNRKQRNDGKEVVQYSMDGTIIQTYNSIQEAAKITGIDKRHISAICNGKKNSFTANNYVWRFNGDEFDKYQILRDHVSIDKYDKYGNYLNTYNSIKEANDSISFGDVQSVLYGKAKSAGGFYWCKSDEHFSLPNYSKKPAFLK